MTDLRWIRDLERQAGELRFLLIDGIRRPYALSQLELEDLLGRVTSLFLELQANRQAALLPAPSLMRVVPLQGGDPGSLTEPGSQGGFVA